MADSFSPVVDNIVERSQRSERFGGCERVVEGRNSVFTERKSTSALLLSWTPQSLHLVRARFLRYTYVFTTEPTQLRCPEAHPHPTGSLQLLEQSLRIIASTFPTLWACLTGRLGSTEMREMLEDAMQRAKTADPAVPVRPVKMNWAMMGGSLNG